MSCLRSEEEEKLVKPTASEPLGSSVARSLRDFSKSHFLSLPPPYRTVRSIISRPWICVNEDVEELPPDTECGVAFCRPKLLQIFRSVQWALFFLCLAVFFQGMIVSGFLRVISSTLERRFGFRSSFSGVIISGYDIGYLLFVLPVTYFGGRPGSSKPLCLGIAMICIGICTAIFTIPHFTTPPVSSEVKAVGSSENLCRLVQHTNQSKRDPCDVTLDTSPFSDYKWLFFGVNVLLGVSCTPLITLGVAYIDENSEKHQSSFYEGIFYAVSAVGPALGFLIGGETLNIHTDWITSTSSLDLSPSSRRWIGAWWLGYLSVSIIILALAFPIMCFPPSLPVVRTSNRSPGPLEGRTRMVIEDSHPSRDIHSEFSLRSFPSHIKTLLRNPTFMFVTFACVADEVIIAGFGAFLPKFTENQFGLTASLSAVLIGAVIVPAGVGGAFFGGLMVKKLDLNVPQLIKLCMLLSSLGAVCCFVLLLNCDDIGFAGVTTGYLSPDNGTFRFLSEKDSLRSVCNQGCFCSEEVYDPICGADGVMYFSPCFAGCQIVARDRKAMKAYSACTCLPGYSFGEVQGFQIQGLPKVCDNSCTVYGYLILTVLSLLGLITVLGMVPTLTIILRSVPDYEKSFALGVRLTFTRSLGSVSSTILFGHLIDSSCSMWQRGCMESESGSCRTYDNQAMSTSVFIACISSRVVALFFNFLAWKTYRSVSQESTLQEIQPVQSSHFGDVADETIVQEIQESAMVDSCPGRVEVSHVIQVISLPDPAPRTTNLQPTCRSAIS